MTALYSGLRKEVKEVVDTVESIVGMMKALSKSNIEQGRRMNRLEKRIGSLITIHQALRARVDKLEGGEKDV